MKKIGQLLVLLGFCVNVTLKLVNLNVDSNEAHALLSLLLFAFTLVVVLGFVIVFFAEHKIINLVLAAGFVASALMSLISFLMLTVDAFHLYDSVPYLRVFYVLTLLVWAFKFAKNTRFLLAIAVSCCAVIPLVQTGLYLQFAFSQINSFVSFLSISACVLLVFVAFMEYKLSSDS